MSAQIEFEHRSEDVNPAGNILLRRLAQPLGNVEKRLPTAPTLVEWRLRAAAVNPEAWQRTPRIQQAEFLGVARNVSLEVQATLRTWASYVWFSRAEGWSDASLLAPMIFLAAMPLYRARSKAQYSYELLDREGLQAALETAVTRLQPWARAWFHQVRERAGAAAAHRFQWPRMAKLSQKLLRAGSDFEKLLDRERRIIECFVGMLERKEAPGHGADELENLLLDLYGGADFRELRPVLVAAAARAVEGRPALWSGQQLVLTPLTNLDAPRQQESGRRAA